MKPFTSGFAVKNCSSQFREGRVTARANLNFELANRRILARQKAYFYMPKYLVQNQITEEDYLLAIYELLEGKGEARTSEIASILRVTPGSAEDKLLKMIGAGQLRKNGRGSFEFTQEGYKDAVMAVRKHRLAERMLTDLLGIGWAEAHDESRIIEHAIDEKIAALIEDKLKPLFCPHGNPIPDKNGYISKLNDLPLSKITGRAVVTRIPYEEFDTLYLVDALGLKPGSEVIVEREGNEIWLNVLKNGNKIRLSKVLADIVRGAQLI